MGAYQNASHQMTTRPVDCEKKKIFRLKYDYKTAANKYKNAIRADFDISTIKLNNHITSPHLIN